MAPPAQHPQNPQKRQPPHASPAPPLGDHTATLRLASPLGERAVYDAYTGKRLV